MRLQIAAHTAAAVDAGIQTANEQNTNHCRRAAIQRMSFDATETNSSPYGVHLQQIMQVGEAQNVTLQAQLWLSTMNHKCDVL